MLVAAQHAVVAHQLAEEELAVAHRQRAQLRVAERARRLGHRAQHQAVPAREDLVVEAGTYASLARVVQDVTRALDRGAQLRHRHPLRARHRLRVVRHEQDVPPLEVPFRRHPPVRAQQRRVLAEQRVELARVPYVVAALVALAVRVERRVEPAFGRRHPPCEPAERLLRDAPDLIVARRLPERGTEPHEQRIVVQHLLEVRHEPVRIHAVAREAAADLIVDPSARHAPEGVRHDVQCLGLTGARPLPQREVERHRRRELGRAAEAAEPRLELRAQRRHRAREQVLVERARHACALRARRVQLAHRRRGPRDVLLAVVPGVGHAGEDAAEARHPLPVVGREVRASVERLALGGEEHRHRPAAVSRHRLRRLHVDRVQVRTLLAVDLDADELLVHLRGGRFVLERLTLHHVAPVTRRVADAEQDRLPLGACARQRLGSPRPPVHRVVRVLEQVGAGLAGEMVGHGES